jgi:hypothetical protein
MDVLIEYLNDFKRKLDISQIFNFVISTELKELIIELNQDQLYDLGEDSKGNKLWSFSPSMPYSPYTIKIKQAKGQPTDRLTLRDTGAFYKSFTVEVEGASIILDADGRKKDTNLFSKYGIDILGLNDQNMSIFLERLTNDVIFYIKEK